MAPSTRRRTAASVASVLLPHPDGSRSVRCYVSGMTRAEVVRKLDHPKREGANAFAAGKTTGTTWPRGSSLSGRGSARRHTASHARHVADDWSPLASRPLTRLTPAHVESTMPGLLGRGLSPQTVRHARSTVSRALHDAMRHGLLNRNAAALARPPRFERREMNAVSDGGRPARLGDGWRPVPSSVRHRCRDRAPGSASCSASSGRTSTWPRDSSRSAGRWPAPTAAATSSPSRRHRAAAGLTCCRPSRWTPCAVRRPVRRPKDSRRGPDGRTAMGSCSPTFT